MACGEIKTRVRISHAKPGMFELDARAIGLFRIALGLILIADQLVRLADWQAFHGPDSLMALEPQHQWEGASRTGKRPPPPHS